MQIRLLVDVEVPNYAGFSAGVRAVVPDDLGHDLIERGQAVAIIEKESPKAERASKTATKGQ